MAFDLKEFKLPTTTLPLDNKDLTLEKRIKARTNNIEKIRENSLQRYAQDSMFALYNEEGVEISTNRRFIQLPNLFFNWINVFSNSYALFTHSKQTLPYIISTTNDQFAVLGSPITDGYSRDHVEESFSQSNNAKLYWLHREFI